MNALFVTMVWPQKGTENMYSDLVSEFTERGHHIDVLALSEKRSNISTHIETDVNQDVVYVNCGNIQKVNKYTKVINSFLAGIKLLRADSKYLAGRKYATIIFALPPLTITPFLIRLKHKHNSKLYLLLKEFWPQDPVDLGAMSYGGIVWKAFRYLEKMLYQNSEYIGTMSEAGIRYLNDHNAGLKAEIEVCPNSQKAIFLPKYGRDEIRSKYCIPANKCVFVFGGNFGVSQGIPEFLESVKTSIEKVDDAYFLLIGNGTEFDKVQESLIKFGKDRVGIYKSLPRDEFDKVLSACDVGVISLYPQYTVPNVPSRMISYLLAELPILAAVDKATDAGDIVENAGCGIKVINGETESFVQAVIKLTEKNLRDEMSKCSRKLMLEKYTTEKAYNTIIRHFEA